jgi:TPR repeat protein
MSGDSKESSSTSSSDSVTERAGKSVTQEKKLRVGPASPGIKVPEWMVRIEELSEEEIIYHLSSYTPAEINFFQSNAGKNSAPASYAVALYKLHVQENAEEAFPMALQAANLDFAPAQTLVGAMYYEGVGAKLDWAKAYEFYRKAADQGDSLAQTNVASQLLSGRGCKRHKEEAIRLLRIAAEQNNAVANHRLGYFYDYGLPGVIKMDDEMAAAYYAKGAELGNVDSMVNLGIFCSTGRGTKRDQGRALKLWTKAARKGHPVACVELAKYKLRKASKIQQSQSKKLSPDSSAQSASLKEDFELALSLLERAAKQEYSPAIELLKLLKQQK